MRRRIGLLVTVVAIISICGMVAQGLERLSDGSRADVVIIDTMKMFGELERPEVVFLHDLHTEALEKKGRDCSACHLSGKNYEIIPDTLKAAVEGVDRMSPRFKRIRDAGRQEVMDIYHTHCIDCHTNMTDAGEKSGPVACGECHKEEITPSSRAPMGFDKSLHFRHSKAYDKKCERCHHEFDKASKKLVYVKEKEGSCRYCHKEETEENRISMKLASHLSCIDCHRKQKAEKKKAGPVKCAGCHDLEHQNAIPEAEAISRMERKQPDVTMIMTPSEKEIVARMNPVPFDHKAHEDSNETCIVCHHESLNPCSKCHTLGHSKDGNGFKAEHAMHTLDAEQSCMGCHNIKQHEKKCAGCHVFLEKSRRLESESCMQCHNATLPEASAEGQAGAAPSKEAMNAIAAEIIQSRKAVTGTYNDEDIPEKLVIKELANKYKPVKFPHRKIVRKLVDDLKDSKLANYFHLEKGTVCQGCHHNSPPAKKPPRCGNCHGMPFDEKNPFRPGIMGAYHQQCMGCHEVMGIEKPMGCTECHKESEM